MNHSKISRIVGTAILAAVVVVLQLLAGTITVGTFSISLVLIPIVVGAAIYGATFGAILGATFGLVVFIASANGTDAGGNVVFNANPFLCFLVCVGKGALSGWCAGLVYRLVAKNSKSLGRSYAAVLLAAVVAPLVNTGVFCISMFLFFRETLQAWAGGSNLINYMLFTLAGINFLIELGINLVFSPAISTIIKAVQKSRA